MSDEKNETVRRWDRSPYCDDYLIDTYCGDYVLYDDYAKAIAEQERAFMRTINAQQESLAAKDAIIQHYAEGVERLTPLAEIGRLAVEKRKAQISKDNTPAGDLREVLLRRANLLDADADLDDATSAYLAAQRETEEPK